MDVLKVEHLSKKYENQPLLEDLSLEVHSGELLCLLGRSGSGKSTLLRIITGIELPDGGRVLWNGEDMADVPPHQRGFGLMFQDFALFPHLNVEENVAFGLRLQKLPASELKTRVHQALEQVNMTAFAGRRVTDLSGGEQQRVALARSLAARPRLLLLDEPLGALDRALRSEMQEELRVQLQHSGIPAIYVTHDQEEALALSDRIALLHNGRIEQSGIASEVYARPASLWVAEFLGMTNLLEGEVTGLEPFTVRTRCGQFHPIAMDTITAGSAGTLLIKPFGVEFELSSGPTDSLTGVVEACIFQVDHYMLQMRCADELRFHFSVQSPIRVGERISLHVPPQSLLWFKETG